jgi:hypothetical protein
LAFVTAAMISGAAGDSLSLLKLISLGIKTVSLVAGFGLI